ncbi:MAG: hypothetical protein Q9219_003692 [cf. Caloplaca sp. 3 TL-2023]
MLYVVPPDWQLFYFGSAESLSAVNRSMAIQHHQTDGKLQLKLAPQNGSYPAHEQRNRMLTDADFYREYLPKAEWLLMYHADSILCANAQKDLNDWLMYDWIGTPWYNYGHWNGGGGLSLRRVSRIKQVLNFQSRQDDADSEDRWLTERIKVLPGIKLPKPRVEETFAVEGVWDEKPMGFHVPLSDEGLLREVWDNADQRKKIYDYCPEIKIIMNMKLERERCEEKTQEQVETEEQAQGQAKEQMTKQIEEAEKERKEKEMQEQKDREDEEEKKGTKDR